MAGDKLTEGIVVARSDRFHEGEINGVSVGLIRGLDFSVFACAGLLGQGERAVETDGFSYRTRVRKIVYCE